MPRPVRRSFYCVSVYSRLYSLVFERNADRFLAAAIVLIKFITLISFVRVVHTYLPTYLPGITLRAILIFVITPVLPAAAAHGVAVRVAWRDGTELRLKKLPLASWDLADVYVV